MFPCFFSISNILLLKFLVPGGLNFENSVQTPLVSPSDRSKDLRLEALTKKVYLHAANGVSITSHANDIVFSSVKDTRIVSNRGKVRDLVIFSGYRSHVKITVMVSFLKKKVEKFFHWVSGSFAKSFLFLIFKGNAQFIFLCNPRKSSFNVFLMNILKSTVTKKVIVCLGEKIF